MADSRAQAYALQLDALARTAEALPPEAEERIRKLLDDASREIVADLARSPAGSYNSARLQALKAQVDRVMEQFASHASSQVNTLEAATYQETARAIDATVAAATSTLAVQPVLDTATLRVVQGYTADLIGGLSRDASAKINAAIQRAFLGHMDLAQLAREIGTARYGAFSGLFNQVGEHAVSVALNEIRRLQSIVSMARIRELKAQHAGLAKGWRHIPVARVPRITHILANGQVREPDESFLVGGEDLMYPRDPAGSPANTINCSCLLYPAVSNEALQSSDRERALLASYGVSVVNAAA